MRKQKASVMQIAVLLLLVVTLASAVSQNYDFNSIESAITGFAHKPSHNPGGGGQGGGGGGGTTTATSGSVGAQKVVGIYPITPAPEETLKNGPYTIKVKITFAGSPSDSAQVTVNSTIFGPELVKLDYDGGAAGIYSKEVIIKNVPVGKYAIQYLARDREADQGSIFVNFDPVLKFNTKLKQNYDKGDRIVLDGAVLDFAGQAQQGVNTTISGALQGILFEKTLKTDVEGKFLDDYLISYASPAGIWNITFSASDDYGNYGALSFNPKISERGAAQYAVNFISPLIGASYKREELIPISIELREKDILVGAANVTFISPRGERITLQEIENGMYAGTYVVRSDDPLGEVRLAVEAAKQTHAKITKVGGDSIPIKILPLEMKFDIISPASDTLYTNTKVRFVTKLTRTDGSPVKGASAKVVLLNGDKIELLEGKAGIYSGSYFVRDEPGTLSSKIIAEDTNKNIGTTERNLFVNRRGIVGNALALFYERIIAKYWWVWLIIIATIGLSYKDVWRQQYAEFRVTKAKREQKEIAAMQIEAEKRYYKERSITRDDFKKLQEGYEKRLAGLREDENKFGNMLRNTR